MRPYRLLTALIAACLATTTGAQPVAAIQRSDKTLVELINGTMGTLPNAMDMLARKLPGGLHATQDAPPQIVRSEPFITRDGYRVSAFEARGFDEGGDVPMVRFTSIQLEQRPCFPRSELPAAFHATGTDTRLPTAPSMLPNRYLMMQMSWGRLSFGTSQESGDCVIAIVGDATGDTPGARMPLPMPQPTTVPGMPDLRHTWPMPYVASAGDNQEENDAPTRLPWPQAGNAGSR